MAAGLLWGLGRGTGNSAVVCDVGGRCTKVADSSEQQEGWDEVASDVYLRPTLPHAAR